MRLQAATLQLDGTIRANGGSGLCDGGHGSGGGIWLNVSSFTGNNLLSANSGTDNPCGLDGGGGGGRIDCHLLREQRLLWSDNGNGWHRFQKWRVGTIYLKAANQTYGDITVDNGGVAEPTTGTFIDTTLLTQDNLSLDNLTVSQATLTVRAPLTVTGNLRLVNGGTLMYLMAI